MTTFIKTSLTRKIATTLGAISVSAMALAGAANAKSNFQLNLQFGNTGVQIDNNGVSGVTFSTDSFGGSWNYCDKYWWKYEKTGKFKYKQKYMKCMGYW